jgi:hypothetical protein
MLAQMLLAASLSPMRSSMPAFSALDQILIRVFLAIGFAMGLVTLFWLRRTGQLRLW